VAYLSYRYERYDLRLPPVDPTWRPEPVAEPPAPVRLDRLATEPWHAPPPDQRVVAMARLLAILDDQRVPGYF
jgi:hypothetical protein